MDEGLDIVGLAVPFAAGTACGIFILWQCEAAIFRSGLIFPIAGLSFCLLCLLLSAFLLKRPGKYIHYAVLFFCVGCFCAINGSISGAKEGGGVAAAAEASAGKIRAVIESIPYKDVETCGVVKALTTGDRSGLGRETTGTFRRSGAAHLLALSGLHLGIIYLLLLWVAAPLGRSPAAGRLRSLLVVGLSGYYSIATGRSPSIMRAFYFIALNETSKLLCLRQKPLRTLCTALMLQLVLSPEIILSAGFQLSYLAMTGITVLYPILKSWYPSEGKTDRLNIALKIWNVTALSLSCQVFTAPVVWYCFGTFPKYFLITNLLALPLTTAVMLTSVAAIVLTAAGLCPACLISLNEQTVQTLIRLLTIISEM